MTPRGLPSDVARDIDAYVTANPGISVAAVLGRFGLDPDEYAGTVAEHLDQPNPLADAADASVTNWGESA